MGLGGEVQTAEFLSKRLWVLTERAPPVLCSWGLRVAALWRLPWLMRNPLLVLRSSIAIYSSLTCSPLFSKWLFLTTSGSSQPPSLFHNACGSVQDSWVSMLVQCRWILCFTAQLQAIKWLNHIMLCCISVSSFSSILATCTFRLLPPAVPSSLNNFRFVCVLYRYRCFGGFVFQILWGEVWWLVCFSFVLVVLIIFCVSALCFGSLLKTGIWVLKSV